MKLISLNVGKPQPYRYKGHHGYTSIFKSPVEGKRNVSLLNIEGDEQSDLTVHGGELKAVYAYDVSYYNYWKNILHRDDWGYGLFGENLTTESLPDDKIYMGNVYEVGSVHLKAIQPRFPCFKLNIRFQMDNMIHLFMQQHKSGTYFSVIKQGSLQAGDSFTLAEESKHKITIQQLVDAYYNKGADKNLLSQILAIEFLPDRLKHVFKSYAQ